MKPPARQICIDAVEDLWRNYDDAKAPAAKLLQKWRPHVLPPVPRAPQRTNEAAPPTAEPTESRSQPQPDTSPVDAMKAEGDMNTSTAGMPVAAAG
ncbi:MAG: hypothetical protein Q9163_004043 [Psora crenata]